MLKHSINIYGKQDRRTNKNRLILTILFCLIAIFQSGLRDINKLPDANDTPVYRYQYQELLSTPWPKVLSSFSLYSSDYQGRDSGHPILMKLSQLISDDFTFFMFLTAIIFIIPFGMIVYKYAKTPLAIILAFMIYFSIYTNIVNSFMRQAITLGLCLMAIPFVINRKWAKFFGVILVATTIHSSAVIGGLLYFLPRYCKTRRGLLISMAAAPVLIFYLKFLLSYFLVGSVYENYVYDDIDNPVNYILLMVIVSVAAFAFFDTIKKVHDYEILIGGCIGSMLLLPIVFMGGTVLRISYYYSVLIIPLVPVIIDNIKLNKTTRLMVYIASISFFLYFIFR